MGYELRPYQQECVDIIDNMEKGSGLVSMSMGLGKTVVFSHIKRKGRVLILSHREELVHQPEKYYDCSFGVERAEEFSNGEEVVSASVQTLVRRLHRFNPDDFDTIITDEAHHAVAPSYRKIYDYFNFRLHVGFTATPNRADKIGLNQVFDKIIFHKDLKWGIKNGYLCDIECKQVDIGYDLRKVKRQMGDYNQTELSKAVNQEKMNKGVARAFKEHAVGQTVVFAVDVSHVNQLTKEINKLCGKGTAEAITGQTPNRNEILDRFRRNELKCIVNCMVLTEGTDLPMIQTVIMARPTQNESLYQQAVGRCLRLYPGKDHATLIDCVGIAGKLGICTAPDLLGLDKEVVPKNRQNKIKGSLLEMEETISTLCEDPDGWIIRAKAVNLFAENIDLNTRDINFMMHVNGSMSCPLGQYGCAVITPIDDIGLCNVYYQDKQNNCQMIRKNVTPQKAVDVLYNYLNGRFYDARNLWDMNRVSKWGKAPVTKPQKNMLHNLMHSPWYREKYGDTTYDTSKLNKYQASILIDKLMSEKKTGFYSKRN